MELNQFIGKVVIKNSSKERYRLCRITSPCIEVESEKPNSSGYPSHYIFNCINGDPISRGILVFENPNLTEPFKEAYNAHCRSEDGYWEDYGYWMRKD
jgi:hypothetical protein